MSGSDNLLVSLVECQDLKEFLRDHLIPYLPSCARGVLGGVSRGWFHIIVSSRCRVTINSPVKFACWVSELMQDLPERPMSTSSTTPGKLFPAELLARYNSLLVHYNLKDTIDYLSGMREKILSRRGIIPCRYKEPWIKADYNLPAKTWRHLLRKHPSEFATIPRAAIFPEHISSSDFYQAMELLYSGQDILPCEFCSGQESLCDHQIVHLVSEACDPGMIEHVSTYFSEDAAAQIISRSIVGCECLSMSILARPKLLRAFLEINNETAEEYLESIENVLDDERRRGYPASGKCVLQIADTLYEILQDPDTDELTRIVIENMCSDSATLEVFCNKYNPPAHIAAGRGIPDDVFVKLFSGQSGNYARINMSDYNHGGLRQLILIGGKLATPWTTSVPDDPISYIDTCISLYGNGVISRHNLLGYIAVCACDSSNTDTFIGYLESEHSHK